MVPKASSDIGYHLEAPFTFENVETHYPMNKLSHVLYVPLFLAQKTSKRKINMNLNLKVDSSTSIYVASFPRDIVE